MKLDTLTRHAPAIASGAIATAALAVALFHGPIIGSPSPAISGGQVTSAAPHPIYLRHMLAQHEGGAIDPACHDGTYSSIAALPAQHPGCEYREAGPAAYAWCGEDRSRVIVRSLDRGVAVVVDCSKP